MEIKRINKIVKTDIKEGLKQFILKSLRIIKSILRS